MKKLYTILIAISMAFLTVLCSCGAKNNSKLKVVGIIFPEYDWVREITKDVDNIDLTLVVDKTIDLHSFQPSMDDIVAITSANLLIYSGGESEEWIIDALESKRNDSMVVLNLLEILGDNARLEETIEGMESSEEELEYDEHVWLSLKNASLFVNSIKDALISLDSNNKDKYIANANSYIEKLNKLDSEYKAVIQEGNTKTLLFGDRFPFLYFVKDYGLSYYAAFKGCSAQSEASFETIVYLAKKVDELNLSVILTIEGNNSSIAETIKNNTRDKNQKILALNSIQSISLDLASTASYLKIMEENLSIIQEAVA